MKTVYIYRSYRTRKNGQPVGGTGKKLALGFHPEMGALGNVLTSISPNTAIEDDSIIMNYGRSTTPQWWDYALSHGCKVINHPHSVANSVDKVRTLQLLKEANVPHLAFTTSRTRAASWVVGGEAVIIRHTVTGKGGAGVELYIGPSLHIPNAPLYTKFFDKTHEFRVHVMNGRIIDYVQKRQMSEERLHDEGLDEADNLIRNHDRGWIFVRGGIIHSNLIKNIAIDATKALGMDFAGVDILAKIDGDGNVIDAVVCETNSAPGMSGPTTLNAYINAVKEDYSV